VLQIAPQYIPVGARYRFEVPADLCIGLRAFGAPYLPVGSMTVWELEIVRTIPLPAFVAPDPSKQKTTTSGLKYEVLTAGTGQQPSLGTPVKVRYTGWLTDGTVFDASAFHGDRLPLHDRGEGRRDQGWNEGVALMQEGAIWRFEIPGSLAYGAAGSPAADPAERDADLPDRAGEGREVAPRRCSSPRCSSPRSQRARSRWC
jgi:FKBP-type peptidyl-prolyl cis-trans isomerase